MVWFSFGLVFGIVLVSFGVQNPAHFYTALRRSHFVTDCRGEKSYTPSVHQYCEQINMCAALPSLTRPGAARPEAARPGAARYDSVRPGPASPWRRARLHSVRPGPAPQNGSKMVPK